jgi:hypothetical protein
MFLGQLFTDILHYKCSYKIGTSSIEQHSSFQLKDQFITAGMQNSKWDIYDSPAQKRGMSRENYELNVHLLGVIFTELEKSVRRCSKHCRFQLRM